MRKKRTEKWGFYDITDEQAEKINNGDIEELNAFFIRNYEEFKGMAYKELCRNGNIYGSEKEIADILNAFYLDLHSFKLEHGANISFHFHLSALAVDRSSYFIARKLSVENLNRSYKRVFEVSPITQFSNMGGSGADLYNIDLVESAPSPQDEIDEEENINDVFALAELIKPFLTEKAKPFAVYYLSGIRACYAEKFLCRKGGASMYKRIEKDLRFHWKEILALLEDRGCMIVPYLATALPVGYEEEVLPRIQKAEAKREKKEAVERAKAERKAEKKTPEQKREELRIYNREYARKRREKQKALENVC